ncbi:MAG: metallophosphoesterase [Verrucomicrobiota bacterium]|jgi:predicted MPP superfamily phosphohydrolase|nr:metallophosphoesterase [Verrucomicrobiota bacterium]
MGGYAFLHLAVYIVWVHPLRSRIVRWLGALFLLVLIPLPGIAWRASHSGHLILSDVAGTIAYLLMAPLLWHACWWLVLLLLNAGLHVFHLLTGSRIRPLKPRAFRVALLTLLALTIGVSLHETHHIRVAELIIRTPLLPPGAASVRIAQISDMHLDVYPWSRKSAPVLRQLHRLQPDLLLSTGDFLDAPVRFLETEMEAWAAFQPPLGKYAILGNHEGYKPLQNALQFHQAAGFHLLRASTATPLPWLRLVGVDDPAVNRQNGLPDFSNEERLPLPTRAENEVFTLLLKHQPVVSPWAREHVNLQLSGHTHGGQIFPFHFLVALVHPGLSGLHPFSTNGRLYINRGTGYWGAPFRLLAPPEITLITLQPEEDLSVPTPD